MNSFSDAHTPADIASDPSTARVQTRESNQQEMQALKFYFTLLLILVFLITGSINLFLRRQVSLIRAQVSELSYIVSEYNKVKAPLMDEFVGRLREYGKTHADFAPILARYVRPETNAAAAPPVRPPGR